MASSETGNGSRPAGEEPRLSDPRLSDPGGAPPRAPKAQIGAKLAFATLGVLLVTSTLLYFELSRREHEGLVTAKVRAGAMVADLFAASLGAPLDFADNDAIQAELANLKRNPEVACAAVWLGADAKPVAELRGGCDASAPLAARDFAGAAVYEDRVELARLVTGPRGREVGKARVVFSLARENAAYEASRLRILGLSALLAVGTAVLLLFIARRQIVLPLARLAEAAKRIGAGDLGAKAEIHSADEIGQLADVFNRMSDRLRDREQRLQAATKNLRDLFDHMQQAILAFDRSGRVAGETSRQAKRIFGRPKLEGESIQDLLYSGVEPHDVDARAFAEWLETAFDVAPDDWVSIAELAPTEVVILRPDGKRVPLEIELRPIEKEGRVERVMLLATDVSEKRRLEEAVEAQEEEHARRIAAMRRLVAGGAHLFVAFTEMARDHVADCLARVGPVAKEMHRADIDAVFRRVHTMKGEARAFDLRELEADLGALEETLSVLRKKAGSDGAASTADVHDELVAGLHRADDAILRSREDFVAASPVGRAALDQMTVQRSDVEELRALVEGRDDAIAKAVARITARRFGESTATLVDMVPVWAARENKQVELDIEGKEVRVSPALARALTSVLGHLVRNAIAHGVETALDRTRVGKEPRGVVRVRAKEDPRGPTIVVEDDGRGLDAEQIAARARELGIDTRSEGPSELVFRPGLTTREAPTDLAGRGVGLDAVRAELQSIGYVVKLESEPGKFTRYVLTPA
jgi:HAMP domain-containing protein/HPt (histidine-containing phosphotransfer) domain-containing protein